jgi:hypothetical protein
VSLRCQGRQASALHYIGPGLYATGKVLLRILLACLTRYQYDVYLALSIGASNLRRLSNLGTNHLPLVRLVFFDSIKKSLALWVVSAIGGGDIKRPRVAYLVFSKLGVVHILLVVSEFLGPLHVPGHHTLYQCFFTLPSVRVGNDFAISAQLFPASRIFFSLNSSAGVHGVFVRLFLGGGSMGAAAMTGSPIPGAEDVGAAGADMTMGGPGARLLLFRAAVCWAGDASGLTAAGFSPAPGCAKN